ncbi:MAG TPA: hypothetical protein PLP07_13435 [Pyrinomonadaceae bacterium]|nr:hypothetical protein [Pyrinomonadaceae bacterium]HQY66761.1 hypothetical protein [Pyrinomonadaceae bacterium]HRA39407.1 hypothetical protein [Pyrinomonadaceae bacterium]
MKRRDPRSTWNFPDLCEQIKTTRVFPEDEMDCLAAFFAVK